MSVLAKFYEMEKAYPNKTYFHQPFKGEWLKMSWSQVGAEARKFAQALKNQNLPAGSNIALLSKNCAHWIIADLGIWMAGHVSVPLYPTLKDDSIRQILEHSESKLLIAGKLDDWKKQKNGVPTGIPIISFPLWPNEGTKRWEDFLAGCSEIRETRYPLPKDIATIIYTSGTTGNPKGVVHHFEAMGTHVVEALKILHISSADRFFSYLPLSHVAERILIECATLYSGGEIYFAESLESFKSNVKYAKPTIFLAVPRIWQKLQQGILRKLPQEKLSRLLSIPIVGRFIASKIKNELGLGQVRFSFSGASAMPKDLLIWFDQLHLPIFEDFGMTENFGVSNLNYPGNVKYGTVGKTFPTTQIKIAESGEVLTKSAANMVGYFKDKTLTDEMIDKDGWLHTGDKGEFDQEGYLRITGRVKDLFKTSKGKYVAPLPIEGLLSAHALIEYVCVLGSGLSQPLALIVLSEEGKKTEKPVVEQEMSELMKFVNQKIESYEKLNNIVVLNDNWSIDNGILTPTMKIKRNIVESMYGHHVHGWGSSKTRVIFHT